MFKNITICTILVGVITLPTTINADDIVPLRFPPKVAYMLLANELGTQYSIPPARIKHVLKNESDYSQQAIGDHGKAVGIAQFHKDTFKGNEKLYFNIFGEHLNYDSAIDQEKLMTWMWATYPHTTRLWTTYKVLK